LKNVLFAEGDNMAKLSFKDTLPRLDHILEYKQHLDYYKQEKKIEMEEYFDDVYGEKNYCECRGTICRKCQKREDDYYKED
jgi:hypothetical protein